MKVNPDTNVIPVTYLGPAGTTFSDAAYQRLAIEYRAPRVIFKNVDGLQVNYYEAKANEDVLPMLIKHGGYASIAMDTLTGGRVTEPIESFIELLQTHGQETLPVHVIGAVMMRLHFCLMMLDREGKFGKNSNIDFILPHVKGVIAHPKAIDACRQHLINNGITKHVYASSNGEAARLVAKDRRYAKFAVLGPQSAADTYLLRVLDPEYEDRQSKTTFFLLGPRAHQSVIGEFNRAMVVFEVEDKPKALLKAMKPFGDQWFNMMQIHSMPLGHGKYHFLMEFKIPKRKIAAFTVALDLAKKFMVKHIVFGPFEVQ